MIITTKTFARAWLIGNPSDGYFGKTISFTVRNFASKVVLYESPFLEIKLHKNDKLSFSSIDELTDDIKYSGYYGGIRLIKATIKVFYEYCQEHNINFEHKNFTISYDSNIPMRVGLAGSSAIVTSVMKALMEFYNVNIPKDILPNIILSVEKDELKIGAGLQDRVIQVFEDIVFMDFNKDYMKEHGFGDYEKLNIDKNNLPKFYIAYSEDLSEGTEVFHNNIRERYERGEKQVLDAMQEFAHITEEFKKIIQGKKRRFKIKSFSGYLINISLKENLVNGDLLILPYGDLSDGLKNQLFLNFNLKEMVNNEFTLDKYIFLNSNLNENNTDFLSVKIKKALMKLAMQCDNKIRLHINNNRLLILIENNSYKLPLIKFINKRNTLNLLNTHLQLLNIVNSFI